MAKKSKVICLSPSTGYEELVLILLLYPKQCFKQKNVDGVNPLPETYNIS